MTRKQAAKRKSGSLSVNFKGVEIGKKRRIPEDDYLVEVESCEEEVSKSDNEQIKWTFSVVEGKHAGTKLYLYTPLTPDSLWKLGALLQALGHEVPDDEMDLELEDYVGETLMAVVADDVYQGEKRSKLVDFYAADEEDEPEGKSKSDGKGSGDKRPRSERNADKDDDKPARGRRGRKTEEDDDDKPARGKKASKKDADDFEPIPAEDVQEMDEDELADVIERADIDVDLDDYSTLRKQRAAVIDALEEADLIAESGGADKDDDDDRPTRGSRGKPARGRAKEDDDDGDESPEDRKKRLRRERRAARG